MPQISLKEAVDAATELKTIQWLLRRLILRREDLVLMLKMLNLKGKAAEIGVFEGEFSEHILKYSGFTVFYSIDPWQEFDADVYRDVCNVPQNEQEKIYKYTVRRLKKFKKRSSIIRKTSYEASRLFKPESLDFVYIDANHKYLECKRDMYLWWPKLKKGGIFSGHDYFNGEFSSGSFGVKKAVDEFVKKHKQCLFITPERSPNWYLIKDMHVDMLCLFLKVVLSQAKFKKFLV